MEPFTYTALPVRVTFGAGSRKRIADEVRRLNCRRAVVLCTPGRRSLAEEVSDMLGDLSAGILDRAVMHAPVDNTMDALQQIRRSDADCTVAVGGGTAIGLGKAIALRADLPQIAIPTTYAGSEMTPFVGQTENGVKTTQRSLAVLPETVIYDVSLTLSLPPVLSGTSGMNAIAHAVEALYAKETNPVVALMAEEGIRALGTALPRIVEYPERIDARSDALYGAWLCSAVLAGVGMSLHHKLCHTIGGTFNLSHAETHSVVLPHAVAYNAPATTAAMARVARALNAADAAQGLYDLARRVGAPSALKDIGMPEDGIDRAADLAVSNPYWNPRPVERQAVRDLIARAWAGEPPRT